MSDLQRQKNEIAIFTKAEFLKEFEPMNMMRKFRSVNTLKKAVTENTGALSMHRKQLGEETIEAIIKLHLIALNQAVNVHEKLNDMQIFEITLEILERYYFMSMVEIAFVFKKAKTGEYGRINYALNMPDVLGWFDKYAEERCQYFMQLKTSEGIEHKQNAQSSIVDEAALEVLKEFKTTLSEDISKKDAEFEIFKSNIKK